MGHRGLASSVATQFAAADSLVDPSCRFFLFLSCSHPRRLLQPLDAPGRYVMPGTCRGPSPRDLVVGRAGLVELTGGNPEQIGLPILQPHGLEEGPSVDDGSIGHPAGVE